MTPLPPVAMKILLMSSYAALPPAGDFLGLNLVN